MVEYMQQFPYLQNSFLLLYNGKKEYLVRECIAEGILKDFLMKNRAEAIEMSIFEYDEEKHMRQVREEGEQMAEERMSRLIEKLMKEGRSEDLERAAKDTSYRRKLLEELGY